MDNDKHAAIRKALLDLNDPYANYAEFSAAESRFINIVANPNRIAALLSDLDSARAQAREAVADRDTVTAINAKVRGERDAERIRADANEQDANRYRWLRGNYSGAMELLGEILYFTPEKLDAAITAAIEKEKND